MTNAQVLLRTVGLADAWLEHTLEVVEIDLRDSGATLEEIENAVGPGGFMRRVLEADRDQQIAEVEKWLAWQGQHAELKGFAAPFQAEPLRHGAPAEPVLALTRPRIV